MLKNINSFSILRVTLGIYFIWVGILKLFVVSPGLLLLQNSIPETLAGSQLFSFLISFLELLLGFAFLSDKFTRLASLISGLYLAIVMILVIFTQGFDPRFPVLSLAGESTLKNLVLIAASITLFTKSSKESQPVSTVKT